MKAMTERFKGNNDWPPRRIGEHHVLLWLIALPIMMIAPLGLCKAAEPGFNPSLVTTVYFDYDRYDIRPSEGKVLRKLAGPLTVWLAHHPEDKVIIEGHTDERKTVEYNLALGQKLAESTQKYLINLGVPAHHMKTVSCGKERPVDPGHTEAAWAKNRRVEIRIKSGETSKP